VLARHLLGERANLMERCEVGAQPVQVVVARPGPDVLERLLSATVVAAVDEQRRAMRGQLRRERAAEAVRGAGDQDRLLVERSHHASFRRRRRA